MDYRFCPSPSPTWTPTTPRGALVRQVLGAISQYERMVIRPRMASGKAAKKAGGGYVGGQPPYGTQAEKRALVPLAEEAKVVEIVTRLRRKGESYRAICAALEAAGLRPRRASAWQPAVVRRIAQRAESKGPEAPDQAGDGLRNRPVVMVRQLRAECASGTRALLDNFELIR